MTKMKTAELSGAYLSLFVAKALGYKDCFINLQGDCVQAYTKNGLTQYREIRFDNKPDVILKIMKDTKLYAMWDNYMEQWYVEAGARFVKSGYPFEVFYSRSLEKVVLRAFVYTKYGSNVEIDL